MADPVHPRRPAERAQQRVVHAVARHADLDVTSSIHAHTNLDAMRTALDNIDREVG